MQRKLHIFPNGCELRYERFGSAGWRHIFVDGDYSSPVGPFYPTKEALLLDKEYRGAF